MMTAVLSVISAPLWAAEEGISDFYALADLSASDTNVESVKPLSDAKLGTVEGSARLPGWNNDGARQHYRGRQLEYLVYRLLNGIIRNGGTASSLVDQRNVLIQVNVAVGNSITQTNNAVQSNTLLLNQSRR
jgi:hypothetical protein